MSAAMHLIIMAGRTCEIGLCSVSTPTVWCVPQPRYWPLPVFGDPFAGGVRNRSGRDAKRGSGGACQCAGNFENRESRKLSH